MLGVWRGEIGDRDNFWESVARWTVPEDDDGGPGDGLEVLRASAYLVDAGDVDAMEQGGVGIDDGLRFLAVDVAEPFDDRPALVGAGCEEGLEEEEEEEEDDDEVSFSPHEARTLFSTLTVSSRNIKDSWSL